MPTTISGTSLTVGSIDLTTPLATADGGTGLALTSTDKTVSASGSAPTYACRAYVAFDSSKNSSGGTDTANTNRLILSSGNVTSVQKNGTGTYIVTFTTAMPDAFYAVTTSASKVSGSDVSMWVSETNPPTTTTLTLFAGDSTNVIDNKTYLSVAVFR